MPARTVARRRSDSLAITGCTEARRLEFRFEKLPPELRDEIHSYVVLRDVPIISGAAMAVPANLGKQVKDDNYFSSINYLTFSSRHDGSTWAEYHGYLEEHVLTTG